MFIIFSLGYVIVFRVRMFGRYKLFLLILKGFSLGKIY